MKIGLKLFTLVSIFFLIAGCETFQNQEKQVHSESEKLNQWLNQAYAAFVDIHPEWQTSLGIKKDYDKLEDFSDEAAQKDLELAKQQLRELKKFDVSKLDHQAKISYKLYKKELEKDITNFQWRYHSYPVNQLFGRHSEVPAFMINMHKVDNIKDAKDYIARVHAVKKNFQQLISQMKVQEEKGIIPPKFVFPKVKENIVNLISGKPLDKSKEDTALLADFKRKISELEISKSKKTKLEADLVKALKLSFLPAYKNLLAYWSQLAQKATTKAGVWKLPKGDTYYSVKLNHYTTTEMTADEIHKLGLDEVQRIHKEMKRIQSQLKVRGSLNEFFKHVQTKDSLYYQGTKKGKETFLADTKAIIDNMREKLPEAFGILPKAKLKVKPVEPFREASSASAFYTGPAPDGSRPGIYYVNLYNMKEQPKYTMEALAYHEAIPGHHLQIAIARELDNLPKFRGYIGYHAYSEGWGLYSELVPKEMGFYKDLYSDFGRLSMELIRAIRLVVDTGIHSKKWTREKAIRYVLANSPADRSEAVRSIERYIVLPAQATSYKVGMIKILELRERAKTALGEEFSLADFHDQVLKNGALPLDVLETEIKGWLTSVTKRP